MMAPVMSLKAKRPAEDIFKPAEKPPPKIQTIHHINPIRAATPPSKAFNDYDWDVVDEYEPMWPNEYEKLVKERRDRDDKRDRREERKRRSNRGEDSPSQGKYVGFGGRPDDIENYNNSPPQARSGGAAIAPPPSLQESTPVIPALQNNALAMQYAAGGSVAAKIMAKYGFKDGQGLGKQEQGMSSALQVEKTSKRGGRIIHEKEIMPPPLAPSPPPQQQTKEEPTITEIMKAPSKVVLLRVSLLSNTKTCMAF